MYDMSIKNFLPSDLERLVLYRKTQQELGFDPDKLTAGSSKKIYIKCQRCKEPKLNKFRFLVLRKGLLHRECQGKVKTEKHLKSLQKKSSPQSFLTDLQKNIIEERLTLKHFGYNPYNFTKGVNKEIYIKCVICDDPRVVTFDLFIRNKGLTCSRQKNDVCWRKLRKQTNIRKYGVSYSSKHQPFIDKSRKTKIERYGAPNKTTYSLYSKTFWLSLEWEGCKIDPNQDLPDNWSKGYTGSIRMTCSCGKKWTPMRFDDFTAGRSRTCGHNANSSLAEQEVHSFIKNDLKVDCEHRYKSDGVEFDIYIPSKRIAIEYNGLVWHSEQFADNPRKDYDKYKFCQRNNIRYVGIFEDEWLREKERVQKYLSSLLGVQSKVKIRPQQLQIQYQTSNDNDIKNFLNKHHYIGGKGGFQHVWKCYYQDKLVAVLVVGSPTRQKIAEVYELRRICLHSSYRCYGLWSFLLKNFVKPKLSPATLTSFSDNRRDVGNLYQKIGFKKIKMIRPDYYWIKGQKRYHKSNLKKTVEERKTGKTEKQLREAQGYYRLWDCGKIKWSINL